MRLDIFENTIFQLSSLNITVFVCHVSGSKVNRKERSGPFCLFVFLFYLAKYIIILKHLVPSCQCLVWGLKRVQEVCVDVHDHGNHNSPSHKSFSSTHTRQQTIRISTNLTLTSLVVRGYPNHCDRGDRNLQLGGGKQGAVQLEFQPSPSSRKLHLRLGRRIQFRLTDNSQKLPLRYHCHCNLFSANVNLIY